jgi:hypothetical protein
MRSATGGDFNLNCARPPFDAAGLGGGEKLSASADKAFEKIFSNTAIALHDAKGTVTRDRVFGRLLLGERKDADTSCIGCIESFDILDSWLRCFLRYVAPLKEFAKGEVGWMPGGTGLKERILSGGFKNGKRSLAIVTWLWPEAIVHLGKAAELTSHFKLGKACLLYQFDQFRWLAMNELRTELDGQPSTLSGNGVDPSTHSLACFKQSDAPTGLGKPPRSA